ncbi:MAG: hypothetical protein KDJ77_09695, partial [Rhodobiaceae bacterium]|nr:hypothetical protein [Rhodobiaceae bacterium]
MASALQDLDTNLTNTREAAQTSIDAAQTTIDFLEKTKDILEILEEIDTDAGKLRDIAKGIEAALTLVSKAGPPLNAIAPRLKTIVDKVEKRADDIEKGIDVESNFKPLKEKVEFLKTGIEVVHDSLEAGNAELDAISAAVHDAAKAVGTSPEIPTALQSAIDSANLKAGQINSATSGIVAIANSINSTKASIDAIFNPFVDPADIVIGYAKDFGGLISNIDFLQGPLNILSDALKPVEWALSAVEAVINAVISPVLDPILDSLGITDLFDGIADYLNSFLPDLNPFGTLNTKLTNIDLQIGSISSGIIVDLQDQVETFGGTLNTGTNLFEGGLIREFLTPTDPSIFAVNNASNLVFGYDGYGGDFLGQGTSIYGLGGDDFIAGGLGDDILDGGGGNDILIGGQGNDIIRGGPGSDDGVVMGGFLSEFNFSRSDDGLTIYSTHAFIQAGHEDQGRDEISGVEHFIFMDRTLDLTDFDNFYDAALGQTVGDLNGTTPSRDFMFGDDNPNTIEGLTLDDFITGRGDNDTLYGGTGNDYIEGGPGTDTILGGDGIDTASYISEGKAQNFLALAPGQTSPFTSDESLFGIENLTGSPNVDWLYGSNGPNRLDGRGGDDVLRGLPGADILIGGAGKNLMAGDEGNDVITISAYAGSSTGPFDSNLIIAGVGNDRYVNEGNFHLLWYGGGAATNWEDPFGRDATVVSSFAELPDLGYTNAQIAAMLPDHIYANFQTNTIVKYNASGDILGTDTLVDIRSVFGASGDDVFIGSNRGEALYGGDGNDLFIGGEANFRPIWQTSNPLGTFTVQDNYEGGAGNDIFRPVAGRAFILGGVGNDVVEITETGWYITRGDNGILEPGTGIDTLDFSGSAYQWNVDATGTFIGDPLSLGDRGTADGFTPGAQPDVTAYNYATYNSLERQLGQSGSTFESVLLGKPYLEFDQYENVIGSAYDDFIAGNESANTLTGNDGDDTLIGYANTSGGTDSLIGGAGNDNLIGSASDDRLVGDDGNDRLAGGFGAADEGGVDVFFGGAGNDILLPGVRGDYQLYGGIGVDTVDFFLVTEDLPATLIGVEVDLVTDTIGSGAIFELNSIENLTGTYNIDVLYGDNKANKIRGMENQDGLHGRGGNDTIYGNDGTDYIYGDDGNDLIFGGPGSDRIYGGAGIDTASYAPAQSGDESDGSVGWTPEQTPGQVNADLLAAGAVFIHDGSGNRDDDWLYEIENLAGTKNDDRLAGNADKNRLTGDDGNDVLVGRGGSDTLSGGEGDDTLYGDTPVGKGVDLLYMNEVSERGQYARTASLFTAMPSSAITIELLVHTPGLPQTSGDDYMFFSYAIGDGALANEILLVGQAADINGTGRTDLQIGFHNVFINTNVPTSDLLDGSPHRLSVTMDANTNVVQLYVDGVIRFSTVDASAGQPIGNNGIIFLGQDQDLLGGGLSTTQTLRGGIGDVRIFDHVLSSNDIDANWDTEIANPSGVSGLVANWQANAATGRFTDLISNTDLALGGGLAASQIRSAGGDGPDTLVGGPGADMMDGGAGYDTAGYELSSAGVTVALDGSVSSGGDAEGDTLVNIENINGSAFGDNLTGNAAINKLIAGTGNDTIEGGASGDIVDGGEGTDTASYAGSSAGVNIQLQYGIVWNGDAAGDTLISIENLTGSNHNDTLSGNPGVNVLIGNGGNDFLRGLNGADRLLGGAGDDWLYVDNLDTQVLGGIGT